eukprot:1138167-Pelagomonas_calceolata.AAC.5
MHSCRSVRGLLRNIMPAHVADALEAYEAEREFASMAAFGAPSGAMLHLQSSSNFRKPSDTVCGGLIRAWPKISQPGEVTARSWSGSVRSHPPVFQGALARSACHPPGSIAVSESKNALESERKLGLLRRRSFSGEPMLACLGERTWWGTSMVLEGVQACETCVQQCECG